MNASPDTIGSARDVAGSVDGQLRLETDWRRIANDSAGGEGTEPTERIYRNSLPKETVAETGSSLGTIAFATSTCADIAMVLAVFPLMLFTGPSQADTAYGIAIPAVILSAAPLIAWAVSTKLTGVPWTFATLAARLILASILFAALGSTFANATFISVCLSLLWGLRLQDLVGSRSERTKTTTQKLSEALIPVCAILSLLKYYPIVQQSLMPTAIALYVVALLAQSIELFGRRRATTDNTRRMAASQVVLPWKKSPSTVAYELLLSCLAGLMIVTPVMLLLTDQSLLTLALRSDLTIAMTGFLAGVIATLCLSGLARNTVASSKGKQAFRLEHLHLVFTVFLAALLLSRHTTVALAALFFTCGAAGAIAVSINNLHWQKALSIAILIVASVSAYLYLSPLQSSWLPIHVIRSLAAVCLFISVLAAFTWARSRLAIFKMVAHLIPLSKTVGWLNDSPESSKRRRPSIHE